MLSTEKLATALLFFNENAKSGSHTNPNLTKTMSSHRRYAICTLFELTEPEKKQMERAKVAQMKT